MRIVLASLPLQGHLPPIAALGQALRKQGHDVTICTADTESAHKILAAHSPDCQHLKYRHPFTEEEEAAIIGATAARVAKSPWEAIQKTTRYFGEQQVLAIFPTLDEYVAKNKPDLMVVDFATWGAWDVAEKHKIPAVMAATSPISVAINVMGAYNLWWSQKVAYEGPLNPGVVLPSYERLTWVQRWFTNPLLKVFHPLAIHLTSQPIRGQTRKSLGFAPRTVFKGASPNTNPPHMVLIMTVPELEMSVTLPSHWHVSGTVTSDFSSPPPALPEGDEVRAWLEEAQAAGDHVVYVAFGTLANLTEKQVVDLATAFLALSDSAALLKDRLPPVGTGSKDRSPGIRFLWSIKGAAAEFLPKGLPRDKILTRPWVAQPSVLAHPAVSLFVTHAGMNSMMEGVGAGKPLFCLPYGADQYINAQHVVNKGVGESIPAEQITVEAVKAGVTKVLCDPSYRERASHISDSVRRSPGAKQAVEKIIAFAKNAAAGSG